MTASRIILYPTRYIMAIYPIGNIYGLYPKGDKADINIIG
ncbi:MAG: hypothetical protein ACI9H8_002565, partial [Lysobacterales bacterium]